MLRFAVFNPKSQRSVLHEAATHHFWLPFVHFTLRFLLR